MTRKRVFDVLMTVITVAALALFLGALLAAIWGTVPWSLFALVAVTVLIAWPALSVMMAMVIRPGRAGRSHSHER